MDQQERERPPGMTVEELVNERVREALGAMHARMSEQDFAINELERRVRALEDAVRVLGTGVRAESE